MIEVGNKQLPGPDFNLDLAKKRGVEEDNKENAFENANKNESNDSKEEDEEQISEDEEKEESSQGTHCW